MAASRYRGMRCRSDPHRRNRSEAPRFSPISASAGSSFLSPANLPSTHLQPDVALPMVVAHEKAHQRGITHEGEANFAAFLACAQPANTTYFRYAAYLFATRYLLSEASNYLPRDEVDAAWELLSDGPKDDIRAMRDFLAPLRRSRGNPRHHDERPISQNDAGTRWRPKLRHRRADACRA